MYSNSSIRDSSIQFTNIFTPFKVKFKTIPTRQHLKTEKLSLNIKSLSIITFTKRKSLPLINKRIPWNFWNVHFWTFHFWTFWTFQMAKMFKKDQTKNSFHSISFIFKPFPFHFIYFFYLKWSKPFHPFQMEKDEMCWNVSKCVFQTPSKITNYQIHSFSYLASDWILFHEGLNFNLSLLYFWSVKVLGML